jgi:hypothetical protein
MLHHEQHVLVLPEGYYASPKRIVKALEAMKHQKGMKKGFSLDMSEVDHKATIWVRDLSLLSDNVFQRTRDIPFLSDSSSTRETL